MKVRIKNCTVDLRNELNASATSAITKRRIQQALVRALQRFDLPEGKIRIKHLKMELGDVSEDRFEFEFYQRLENACEELVKQILQEHQYQEWSEKSRNANRLTEKEENRTLEDELERLLRLLEGSQRIPEREQLLRSYFQRYTEQMPASTQMLLDQLVPSVTVSSEFWEDGNPEANAFESLDYLLDLLSENELSVATFSNMLRKYQQRFGEVMPDHIRKTLFSALEDVAPTKESTKTRTEEDFGANSREAAQEKGERMNTKRSKVTGASIPFVLQWIDTHDINGNWLNRLQRAHKKDFGYELQGQLWERLNHFNDTLEINAVDQDTALKTFLTKTYEVEDDLLPKEPPVLDFAEFENENIEDKEELSQKTNHGSEFDENSPKHESSDTKESLKNLDASLSFVLEWIQGNQVTGNWLNRLQRVHTKELEYELAGRLWEYLNAFQEVSDTNTENGDISLRTFLAEKYKVSEASLESMRAQSIGETQFENKVNPDGNNVFEATKKGMEDANVSKAKDSKVTEPSLKNLDASLSFVLDWIQENQVTGNWLNRLQRTHTKELEYELAGRFWEYLNAFQEDWATNTEHGDISLRTFLAEKYKVNESSFERMRAQSAGETQFENKVNPDGNNVLEATKKATENANVSKSKDSKEREPSLKNLDASLSFVLDWIQENQVTGNWLNRLQRAFKKEKGIELPISVRNRLEDFITSDPAASKDKEALSWFLQNENPSKTILQNKDKNDDLELAITAGSNTDEAAKNNERPTDSEAFSFIIRWITSHAFFDNWVKALMQEFKTTFSRDIPASIAQKLRHFEANELLPSSNPSNLSRTHLYQLIEELGIRKEPENYHDEKAEQSKEILSEQFSFVVLWIRENLVSGGWKKHLKKEVQKELKQPLASELESAFDQFENEIQQQEVSGDTTNLLIDFLTEQFVSQQMGKELDANAWILKRQAKASVKRMIGQTAYLVRSWVESESSETNIDALLENAQEQFGSQLEPKIKEAMERLKLQQDSADLDANAVSNFLKVLTETKTNESKKSTDKNTSKNTLSWHLQYVLNWLMKHEVSNNWIDRLYADMRSDLATAPHSQLQELLNDFQRNLAHFNHENPQAGGLIETLTAELFKEEGWEAPATNQEPNHLLAKQLAFSLHWISTHRHLSNWFNELRSMVYQQTGAFMHIGLELLLKNFEESREAESLSQEEFHRLITSLTDALFSSQSMKETDLATSQFKTSEEDRKALLEQAVFLLNWFLVKQETQDWETKLLRDLEGHFAVIHEQIQQVIDDLIRQFEDSNLVANRERILSYVANTWISDTEIFELQESTATKNKTVSKVASEAKSIAKESTISDSKSKDTPSNAITAIQVEENPKISNEQVLFVLHWLAENNIEADGLVSLLEELSAEFGGINPVLEDVLKSYQERQEAQEEIFLEPHELIELLTEHLQVASDEETLKKDKETAQLENEDQPIEEQSNGADEKSKSHLREPKLTKTSETAEKFSDVSGSEVNSGVSSRQNNKDESPPLRSSLDKNYVLEKLKNSLKPESRELVDWSIWIAAETEQFAPEAWLSSITSNHEKSYGRMLSMQKQLLFLESMLGANALEEIADDSAQSKLAMQIAEYVQRGNTRKKNKKNLLPEAEVLLKAMKAVPFNAKWFQEIKKSFEASYKKKMPLALQRVLFTFRKENLLEHFERTSVEKTSLSQKLMGYFNSDNYSDVQAVLQSIEFEAATSWMQQVTEAYKTTEKQQLPLSIFIELSKFNEEHPEWKIEDVSKLQAQLVDTTLDEKFATRRKEESKHSRQSLLQFLQEELPRLKNNENWKTAIEKRYQEQAGRPMPRIFKELITDIEEHGEDTATSKKAEARTVPELRDSFARFAQDKPNVAFTEQLRLLFDKLNAEDSSKWFAAILIYYRQKYQRDMPLEAQLVLLDFSATIDSGSTVDHGEKQHSELKQIAEKVRLQLDVLSAKSEARDRDYLVNLKKWVNEHLLKNWSHMQLKKAYETDFGHPFPIWLKDTLMDRLRREKSPKFRQDSAEQGAPMGLKNVPNQQPISVPSSSEKAKVQKLKKQLENMKEGKDIEVEIVSDAGIMIGWLFWKKCFDKFGWLEEGKFFKRNGTYTGVLAANWLTRLGTNAYPKMLNPFVVRICDLLEEESEYLSDDQLELQMNGYELKASQHQYYQDIMSMWQIAKIEEPSELKELFVRREAIITQTFFGWDLEMVPEAYDALLQKHPIPWPMTFIRFPWTTQTFNVTW